MTKYLYPYEITSSYYAKRGAGDLKWEYVVSEVEKDAALIQRGAHPYIGYVDRSSKWRITDAWWMT